MAVARYLVDKSVWARLTKPAVQAVVAPYADRGLIGTCPITDLEILYSTRNGDEHDRFRAQREAFEYFPLTDEIAHRAIQVQGELAHRGQHRSVSIPDLIVAATAERFSLVVLHYDVGYDRIAEVTGQPTEWVVSRGTAERALTPLLIPPISSKVQHAGWHSALSPAWAFEGAVDAAGCRSAISAWRLRDLRIKSPTGLIFRSAILTFPPGPARTSSGAPTVSSSHLLGRHLQPVIAQRLAEEPVVILTGAAQGPVNPGHRHRSPAQATTENVSAVTTP